MKYEKGGLIRLLDIKIGDQVSWLDLLHRRREGKVVDLGTKMVKVQEANGYQGWRYPYVLVPEFTVIGSPNGPIKVPFAEEEQLCPS